MTPTTTRRLRRRVIDAARALVDWADLWYPPGETPPGPILAVVRASRALEFRRRKQRTKRARGRR